MKFLPWFDADKDGNSVGGTAAAKGVEQGSMTASQTSDASAAKIAELERRLADRDRDLNQLKSSLQKREASLTKQYQEKIATLEKKVRDVGMSNLSDDEKTAYERELANEEAQRWREEAEKHRQRLEEMTAMQQYSQFFKDLGVSDLVMDQGMEALLQSGWDGVRSTIQALNEKVSQIGKENSQSSTTTAQTSTQNSQPLTTNPGSPPVQKSWEELAKQYGSLDEVFEKIESGELPASILPLE